MTETEKIREPIKKGYTIYTKSECKYCIKTKELLKDEFPCPQYVLCDEFLSNIETKEIFLKEMETFIGKSYRTFPMVFYNGKFIGGYTELEKQYIELKKQQIKLDLLLTSMIDENEELGIDKLSDENKEDISRYFDFYDVDDGKNTSNKII